MVSPYMNETFSEWKAFNNKQKRNTKSTNYSDTFKMEQFQTRRKSKCI